MIKLPVIFSKYILLLGICFATFFANAQLLDSLSLDTLTAYEDLSLAIKNPDAVVKLVLRKQHLKSFPKEVFKFKNLQYLDISKNSIKEIPDSIGSLTQLQYFACSKTGLQHISKEIGKLKNLVYLNMNQNDLEYLPPQIGNLEKLEILDLWSNNFNEYPESLKNLSSLKVIDLRNILINDETQETLKRWMPKSTVHMSPSCRCKW